MDQAKPSSERFFIPFLYVLPSWVVAVLPLTFGLLLVLFTEIELWAWISTGLCLVPMLSIPLISIEALVVRMTYLRMDEESVAYSTPGFVVQGKWADVVGVSRLSTGSMWPVSLQFRPGCLQVVRGAPWFALYRLLFHDIDRGLPISSFVLGNWRKARPGKAILARVPHLPGV